MTRTSPAAHDLAGPYRLLVASQWAEASRAWASLGCPYEAALALHDATDEAALRQALDLFTGLGAPAAAQLTRHKMRALGLRSIPAGPRTATRADRADSARTGCTRADLRRAQQRRDRHQTGPIHQDRRPSRLRVLAKLGAPSRGAAAAYVARLGLAGAPAALP